MAYDLAPLRSYVRFYQSVATQVTSTWESLVRTHETARETLRPFEEPLAPLRSSVLAAAFAEPPTFAPGLGSLWLPNDEKDISGLTDVYEVVGRFSFQGEDDENLARVQAIVSRARNEIHVQRTRLKELTKLADIARNSADRLESEEGKRAAEQKAAKLASFAPLASALHQRAKQTMDATRAVQVPALADVKTAAEDYRAYAKRLDQVYQTCLPFLRRSIEEMYDFVECEAPSSWPEHLPIQSELPEEFLMVPPNDSPELSRAKAHVDELHEESSQLTAARDEVVTIIARFDGDLIAFREKEAEALKEIERAGLLVDYATKLEEIDKARRDLIDLEQQKVDRTQRAGNLTQHTKQIESAIRAIEQELSARKKEITDCLAQLAIERDAEPAFIGKDAWRQRVAAHEQNIDHLRNAFAQREALLNQMRIDMSSVGVQLQTEQSQNSLVDRWLADARTRERTLLSEASGLDKQLGASRVIRTPSVADAEHVLAATQEARAEVLERIDRIVSDTRRRKQEHSQIMARIKQVDDELQKMSGFVQSARVASTQGFEEAMRQLAARRRAAVIHHTEEVLGELEKSLSSIDMVFVDPARVAMLKADKPTGSIAAVVRKAAEELDGVVKELFDELDPDLLQQDAMMGQVQREFCDVALQACKNAWA
ncbi:MAG: hypothetical protein FWD57_04740 [Polyangiaceae bacterium]|nr:hypothetical protein [Polyangiaceae bacterium]